MTYESLIKDGYTITNAKITSIDLSMEDHGVLTLRMAIEGAGWGCVYGGYVLGHGYVGASEFKGSEKGLESIMRIMDVVGESRFNKLVGQYIRVAEKGWGSSVDIIGNITKDKWYSNKEFFENK